MPLKIIITITSIAIAATSPIILLQYLKDQSSSIGGAGTLYLLLSNFSLGIYLTSTTDNINDDDDISIQDEAPFVVVNPTGLRVYSTVTGETSSSSSSPSSKMWSSASSTGTTSTNRNIVGTVPFGTIVTLTDLSRLKTGEIMRITFPYLGHIVNGRGGGTGGFVGRIWWSPSVLPLVGNLSTLLPVRVQSPPRTSGTTSNNTNALKCCKYDVMHNYFGNITWEDYRDGRYSAADYRDPIRAGMKETDNIPHGLSNAPPWTIQYQPAGGGGWSAPTWLDQVPIGSGRTGALVGSTASASVIPISTAGLFVPPIKKIPAATRKRKHDKSDNGKIFYAAREALLRGDHSTADKLVGQLHAQSAQENPMASFEYAADLTLAFTANPIHLGPSSRSSSGHRETSAKAGSGRGKKRRGGSARDALVDSLVSSIIPRRLNQTDSGSQLLPVLSPMDDRLARGQLDIRGGVYGESFVTTSTRPVSDTGYADETRHLLHHREYFAALSEHIIAARLQCRDLPSSDTSDGGNGKNSQRKSRCLNFAASLSRTDGVGSSVSSKAWSKHLLSGGAAGDVTDEFLLRNRRFAAPQPPYLYSDGALFGVSISAKPAVTTAPDVEVCGILICQSGIGKGGGNDGTLLEASSNGNIVCSSANAAEIFLAVEIQSRGRDMAYTNTRNSSDNAGRMLSPDELKANCQKRLLKALEVGYDALRKNHSDTFGKVMSATDIRFAEMERGKSREEVSGETCDGQIISDLLRSSATPLCVEADSMKANSSLVSSSALSPSLLRMQFQLSRYLLLSAAADSVPNLQFWADGPVSAWSGE